MLHLHQDTRLTTSVEQAHHQIRQIHNKLLHFCTIKIVIGISYLGPELQN